MLYALDGSDRIVAQPKRIARCPLCRADVRAKCGEHVIWHWAHVGHDGDCDAWQEPETPWHRWWKQRAPDEWCECTMGAHRADILIPEKGVVELQHSNITGDEIRERETFYSKMIWVLDARMYTRPTNVFETPVDRLERRSDGSWHWRWPRLSFVAAAKKRVLFDLGEEMLHVTRMGHFQRGIFVEGKKLTRQTFLTQMGLREATEEESGTIVSYFAEWYEERESRHRVPRLDGKEKTFAIRRLEFHDLGQFDRWRARQKRKGLTLLAWHGDGALHEIERYDDEPSVANTL